VIDIERVRADTPAVDSVVHFNNAGSSLPPRQVVDAVVGYLRLEQLMGGYEAQDQAAGQVDHVYAAAAELVGSSPGEIAFTANASDSWWRAFSSIDLKPGDRVLLGHSEFQANAFALMQAAERGVLLEVVPNDSSGVVDLESLERSLDSDVKLVCLTQISMSNGAIHPAEAVGALAGANGSIFLLDACQAAGQLPLDVERLRCDFLAFTGRKFVRGPRATGILYARDSVISRLGQTPFVDGRSAEWKGDMTYEYQPGALRFEFGEQNFAGKAGLGVAIDYALELGLDDIRSRVDELATALRNGLGQLPGVAVHDEGTVQSGIVTFTVAAQAAADVKVALGAAGINVSAPGRRNAQLDIGLRGIDAVVRAGVHYFNTADEIDRLLAAVAAL